MGRSYLCAYIDQRQALSKAFLCCWTHCSVPVKVEIGRQPHREVQMTEVFHPLTLQLGTCTIYHLPGHEAQRTGSPSLSGSGVLKIEVCCLAGFEVLKMGICCLTGFEVSKMEVCYWTGFGVLKTGFCYPTEIEVWTIGVCYPGWFDALVMVSWCGPSR